MDRLLRALAAAPPKRSLFVALLLFAYLDLLMSLALLEHQPLGLDWAPLWAGARLAMLDPASLYDFAQVTAAQEAAIGELPKLRPFVYPPSALLVFAPFAMLPFAASYAAITLASGAFYVWASSRLGAGWWLLLLPPVFLVGFVGQTTFLVGALIISGLHALRSRPVLAGILFGIATAIKPPILVLLPIALVLSRHWRVLWVWALTSAGAVLASAALLGADLWLDWLRAVPRFQELFEQDPALVGAAITPLAAAHRLGIDGGWVAVPAGLMGLAAVWITFRRDAGVPHRLLALAGGALLVSPYAMNYELALLAPAIAVLWPASLVGLALLVGFAISIIFGLGVVALIAAILTIPFGQPAIQPGSSDSSGPA
jgi:Glycosyltransferase family 87